MRTRDPNFQPQFDSANEVLRIQQQPMSLGGSYMMVMGDIHRAAFILERRAQPGASAIETNTFIR
jgi:hypothetical protein